MWVEKPWREGGRWRFFFRFLAGALTFSFGVFSVYPSLLFAQHEDLPSWLKEENGGWVSFDQARKMHRADSDLLAYLSSLEEARDRYMTSHPSGFQVQYVGDKAVVGRDRSGNLLWAPTLDDYQRLWDGTLLLSDGTLQVIKAGRLIRQVDALGNEAVFRLDGLLDHEVTVDGTRIDYVHSSGGGFTRTIHNPDGDWVEEYDGNGRLIRERRPDGKVLTYVDGILKTVEVGRVTYTYTSKIAPDGTIVATLEEAVDAFGTVTTFKEGEVSSIRYSDGTWLKEIQLNEDGRVRAAHVVFSNGVTQEIVGGEVTQVGLPDGRRLSYASGWLRGVVEGDQSSSYTYTFDTAKNLLGVTVQSSDGVKKSYDSGGQLIQLSRPDGTVETYVGSGSSVRWQYVEPFDVVSPRDFVLASGVSVTGGHLVLAGNGSNFNVHAFHNRSFLRVGGEVSFTFPFMVSANNSEAILALENNATGKAYRRIELYHTGSRLVVRTREGNTTTTRSTAVSSLALNALYWVRFVATASGISVYVWKEGAMPPTRPVYSWSSANWDPRLHVWVRRGSLKIDRLMIETPSSGPREVLSTLGQLRQPVNRYATDLPSRMVRDLSHWRLVYPDLPAKRQVHRPDGIWATGSWPVSPDRIAPVGAISGPVLTNQREVALNLTAQDPSDSDGTTGSGVKAMRFSLDGGKSWSDPELYDSAKTVILGDGDGKKTVWVEFQDVAGNWSLPISHSITLDTTPPALTLISPASTDEEIYTLEVAADGVVILRERWQLGRGTHGFPAHFTDLAGNEGWARLEVKRAGEREVPVDPPLIPFGERMTQRLADGSVALYVDGRLLEVTAPSGVRLVHPVLDPVDGKIVGGWLIDPDGSVTFLQDGHPVWSKTPLGAVYWYLPSGQLEAVEGVDGVVTLYAYRLDSSGEVSAILASNGEGSILFDPKGDVMLRVGADGRPMESSSGGLAAFDLVRSGDRVMGLSVTRDGITRTYDTSGNLVGLTLADRTKVSFVGEALKALNLPDGTTIVDGVFDGESKLLSGLIRLPDGRSVRYQDGKPVEAQLPDGRSIVYTDGTPSRLILSNGLSYALTHNGDGWVAALVSQDQGGPATSETFTQLFYSDDWVLQRAVRADGAVLSYDAGRLSTLTQADGVVISYGYDALGRLASTVAVSPNPNETVIRTEYAYDKIRRVFKGDKLIYEYAYEFEPDGTEVTVIREVSTGVIGRYRDGLLISKTDSDGVVTTYEYTTDPRGWVDPFERVTQARQRLPDGTVALYAKEGPDATRLWRLIRLTLPNGAVVTDLTDPNVAQLVVQATLPTVFQELRRLERLGILEPVVLEGGSSSQSSQDTGPSTPVLARATVTYQGKVRDILTYSYGSSDGVGLDLTYVTDSSLTTRIYDATKRLVAIEQADGTRYEVTYSRDLSDAQREVLETGRTQTVRYTDLKGEEVVLTLPDVDVGMFEERDGEEIVIQHLSRRVLEDGTVLSYRGGRLHEIRLPDGRRISEFGLDADGIPLRAKLTLPDGTVKHIQNGALTEVTRSDGVKLRYRNGVIAEIHVPEEILKDAAISRVTLDSHGQLRSGEVLLSSGDRLTITDGQITGARLADGTVVQSVTVDQDAVTGAILSVNGSNATLSDTRDVKVVLPSGQEYYYRYRLDSAGVPTNELERMTFRDDFEDGNALGWRTTGNWSVSGGDMRGDGYTGRPSYAYAQTGLNWTNYTVTTRFSMESHSLDSSSYGTYGVELSFRGNYGVGIYSTRLPGWGSSGGGRVGEMVLFVNENGGRRELKREALRGFKGLDGTHTLSVKVQDSSFSFYLDGQFIGSASALRDSSLKSGPVGLGVFNCIVRFHEIEVTFPGEDLRDPATRDVDRSIRSLRQILASTSEPIRRIGTRLGAVSALFDPAEYDPAKIRVLEESDDPDIKAATAAIRAHASDPSFPIITEMGMGGEIISRVAIDGSVTLYDLQGRPSARYDSDGRLQLTYTYDSDGHLIKTTLVALRDQVSQQIALARAELQQRTAEALEALVERKGIALGDLKIRFAVAREQLANAEKTLQENLRTLDATKAKGRKARKQKSRTLDEIRAAINQVRAAQSDLDRQYAEALAALEAQVNTVHQQIEVESEKAFTEIGQKEAEFFKGILRQEIHPIVIATYRSVIGRDPSDTELNEEVERLYSRFGTDPAAILDLEGLKKRITDLPDYPTRVGEVSAIKKRVSDWLIGYANAAASEKLERVQELGLSLDEVVSLTPSDVERILDWLDSGSLHFGHSAFLALKEYMASQGIEVDVVELAAEAILIDILVGVIHPRTKGDLELSLFALEKVAKLHGGVATSGRISFDELLDLTTAPTVIGTIAAVNPRQLIRHPDGRRAYVTKSADDGLSNLQGLAELDLTTHRVIRTMTLGGHRWAYTNALALSPDGRILAVGSTITGPDQGEQWVTLVDVERWVVVGKVEGFASVGAMAMLSDGRTLLAADLRGWSGSRLAVIDLASATVVRWIPLPDGLAPMAIAVSSDGRRVYVATEASGQLGILDMATGTLQVLSSMPTVRAMAMHPDGRDLYFVEHNTGRLWRFDTVLDRLTGSVEVGWGPAALAFSPDGAKAYVTNYYAGELAVVDLAGLKRVKVLKVGKGVAGLMTDATGTRLYVADNAGIQVVVAEAPGPAIAHVNGNHYIFVQSVAPDGTVTYREPNQGPSGATLTMTRDEFKRIWNGVVLTPRTLPHPWQVLTHFESQRVTGSFFPLLFTFFLKLALATLKVVALALANIAQLVAHVFTAVGGILQSLGPIGQFLATPFQGLVGVLHGFNAIFYGQLLTGLKMIGQSLLFAVGVKDLTFAGLVSFAQTAALSTGVGIGVTRGLEALGVSPTIASLAGAFAGGFVLGLPTPAKGAAGAGSATATKAASAVSSTRWLHSAVASGLTSTAIQGASLGLTKAGLDPALANIAGIGVGTITSSLLSGVNVPQYNSDGTPKIDPSTGKQVTVLTKGFEGLSYTLRTSLVPTLAGELAFYGVSKLGESLGIDPRISQLAGMPVKAGVSALMSPVSRAKGVVQSMWEGLKEGATNLTISFLGEQAGLDSLSTAVLSRTLTAAFMGVANPKTTIISEVGRAFMKSTGHVFTLGGGEAMNPVQRAAYLAKVNDFSNIVRKHGIVKALELYATSIFQRDAVEEIWRLGGVSDLLSERATFEDLEIKQLKFGEDGKPLLDGNGQPIEQVTRLPVKRIRINDQNEIYLSSTDEDVPVALRQGNLFSIGHFGIGPDGRFFLTDGRIEVDLGFGAKGYVLVVGGQAVGSYFDKGAKEVLRQYATSDRGLFFDENNDLWDGKVVMPQTGVVIEVEAGKVVRFSVPSVDGRVPSELLANGVKQVTLQEMQNVMKFVSINGIANPNAEDIPPEYMEGFKETLAKVLNVDASKIFVLPVYERGNLIKDVISWLFDFFGIDHITNEVIAKMDAEIAARGGQGEGMVVVAYSGGFQPLLKAIERRGYNVETIVAIGAPSFKGVINAPQVKRIINVFGEHDLLNPVIRESFKRPDGTAVEVINIELKGVNHAGSKGYFATSAEIANDPEMKALNVRANQFLAELGKAAKEGRVKRFLLDQTTGVTLEDGKYVVDLTEIKLDQN